jgi:hypothetical protein
MKDPYLLVAEDLFKSDRGCRIKEWDELEKFVYREKAISLLHMGYVKATLTRHDLPLLNKFSRHMWGSDFYELKPVIAEKLIALTQMMDELGYVRKV